MTLADLIDANVAKHEIRERIALRWLARRCRRDADFAASVEEEINNLLVTHQAKIDWSQIDWAEVVKIVLMLLAAFGVL